MVVIGPQHTPQSPRPVTPLTLTEVVKAVGQLAAWASFGLSLFVAFRIAPALGGILFIAVIALIGMIRVAQGTDATVSRWAIRAGLLIAALIAPVTGLMKLAPFPVFGWAFAGAYFLAVFGGVWRRLSPFWKVFNVVFALFMSAGLAVSLQPAVTVPPPAAEGAREESEWKVRVRVDGGGDLGRALQDALVNCAAVDFWTTAKAGAFTPGLSRLTDDDGVAEFGFKGPRWLKLVACTAQRDARDGDPAYAPQLVVTPAPFEAIEGLVYITLKPEGESSPPT